MTTIAPTTHPYSTPRTQPSPALGRPTPPPPAPLAGLAARLAVSLDASVQRFLGAADHNLGHLETQVAHDVQALLNETLRRGAQAKADATPPHCPHCGRPLTRCSPGHARTFQTRAGDLTLYRTRGDCKRCGQWRTPADHALGLADTAG